MSVTIVSVGNGGYNIAADIIEANLFPDARVIVCDTENAALKRNSEKANKTFLLPKTKRGQQYAKSTDLDLVSDIVDSLGDTVIVCATLGGSTGGIYGPLIALGSRLSGRFVCSVTAIPSQTEGKAKTKRAHDGRLQIINSSNLTFTQYNERLSEIEDLWFYEMNKPLVETIASALKENTLQQLSINGREKNAELVPKAYQLEGFPLEKITDNVFRDFSSDYLKQIFDFMA